MKTYKSIFIALTALMLSGSLLNTGCSEDSDTTSTTIQTSSFEGVQGKCTNGGVKIEVLVNGVVDEAQIQYICNGEKGQEGQDGQGGQNATSTTMRTSSFEGAQGKCTNGGVKIEVLVNGVVDDAQTQYICNGEKGQNGQDGQVQCPSGWTNCGGSCIDISTDIANCGACANNCNTTKPQHASTMSCIESQCAVTACETGYTLNDGQCVACDALEGWAKCGGQCIQIDSDNGNCGKCSNVCTDGLTCSNGLCLGNTTCSGTAVNTDSSIDHCGACNNRCPDGQTCVQGKCKVGYGKAYCGIEKVQLGEIDRCGGCNDQCAGGKVCQDNQCVDGVGPTYCSGIATNTLSDVSNCGKCGNRCENSNCYNGECRASQNGYYTDEMYCNGILVHALSDSAHCGGCGNTCAKGFKCSGGTCQPYEINNESILTCNNKTVHPYKNEENCGKCGDVCSGSCYEGVCHFSSSTTTTCNGKTVYPYYDSSNCGGCGNNCGTGKYCKAGVCTNEAATSTTETYCANKLVYPYYDSSNCGGCGISCATNQTCSKGTCKELSNLVVGDFITFGHYEQDNDTTNGKEPVTWRVLDKNASGQYLIISEKALDVQPYNTTYISITWEKSTIRSWLNGYGASYNIVGTSFTSDNFIDTAFTAEEKAKIVASNVPAHANPDYSTSPGSATTDKIFLLSITEANIYFKSDADRMADATRYAVKIGAFVQGSSSGKTTNDGTCTDVHCTSNWWLRSPGDDSNFAALVGTGGSVYLDGYHVHDTHVAVRPALLVNL